MLYGNITELLPNFAYIVAVRRRIGIGGCRLRLVHESVGEKLKIWRYSPQNMSAFTDLVRFITGGVMAQGDALLCDPAGP